MQDITTKAREPKELHQMREELNSEIAALEDAIKAAMGDQEQIMVGPYKITWKLIASSRIDTKATKSALPEIAERFTASSTTRRFLIV